MALRRSSPRACNERTFHRCRARTGLSRSLTSTACAALGLFLLGLNIYGQFHGLRNPALTYEALSSSEGLPLEPRQFWDLAQRGADEEEPVYVRRVTTALTDSLLHYWSDDGVERYNLRIPPRENYWLYLAGKIDPGRFGKYEFHDPQKAVERGVGLCSQHAVILERVLERNGVPARIGALQGHVVTVVGTRWILDPDFGVVIEAALDEVERNPTLIGPAYALANVPPERLTRLVAAYRPPNVEFDSACAYLGWKCRLESMAYVAKWIFPLALLFSACAWTVLSRRQFRPLAQSPSGKGEMGTCTYTRE